MCNSLIIRLVISWHFHWKDIPLELIQDWLMQLLLELFWKCHWKLIWYFFFVLYASSAFSKITLRREFFEILLGYICSNSFEKSFWCFFMVPSAISTITFLGIDLWNKKNANFAYFFKFSANSFGIFFGHSLIVSWI